MAAVQEGVLAGLEAFSGELYDRPTSDTTRPAASTTA